MCMIAQRLMSRRGNGANIPNDVITAAMNRHSDGFGVAWRDPQTGLTVAKFGPRDRSSFRDLLKGIDADKSIEYVAHFRFATHGPEDDAHAHPYEYTHPVDGRVLVFHNGVIPGVNPSHLESDTEVFVRDYLAHLPSRWWEDDGILRLVDKSIGYSKLVLMTDEVTANLQPSLGEEDTGFWYSSDHRPASYWTGKSGAYRSDAYYNSIINDEQEDDWVRVSEGNWQRKSELLDAERSLVPYATSYFGGNGKTTQPHSNQGAWLDEGHPLQPMQTFDFTREGVYDGAIMCDLCSTVGNVYIVEGRAYVEIGHKFAVEDIEEEDGDFCSAGAEVVIPAREAILVN